MYMGYKSQSIKWKNVIYVNILGTQTWTFYNKTNYTE